MPPSTRTVMAPITISIKLGRRCAAFFAGAEFHRNYRYKCRHLISRQGKVTSLGRSECLFAKRLEGGKFRWPRIKDGVMRLSAAQMAALLEVWIGCVSTPGAWLRRKLCSSLR